MRSEYAKNSEYSLKVHYSLSSEIDRFRTNLL